MPSEIPPFPSDRCTRCYCPIGPGGWTVPTVDVRQHSVCEEVAAAEPLADLADDGQGEEAAA